MAINNSSNLANMTEIHAEQTMLTSSKAVVVLEKFGLVKTQPKNKGTQIKFRRPDTFTASTTALTEGVAPTARAFSYTDVTATIAQYGDLVETTDVLEDTIDCPMLNDMSVQVGENVGRTTEALNWGVLKAGTNVAYANGSARNAVNTKLTLALQRSVIRTLRSNKGAMFTKVLDGSIDVGTKPVEASYIAITHTDVEHDIREMAGFIPAAAYGSRKLVSEYEIGAVDNVRYVISPDLNPIIDAGGAKGATAVSTGGTLADVYPILYLAKEAFGCVALGGKSAQSIVPSLLPTGTKDKSDPMGQRGYVSAKYYHVCKILNDAWMVRAEVAVTPL
jgi:N4-gp56 family major capsid protein